MNWKIGSIRALAGVVAAVALVAAGGARVSAAVDGAQFFQTNCVSCHTIGGGRLTGPDLKDVSKRREPGWTKGFMQNPKAVIDGGDPYAANLVKEANGVVMPAVAGLTPEVADALIALIDAESKLPKSRFAGSLVSDAPFTAADIARGRSIFMGTTRLKKGGPACVACHTAGMIGGLGGGALGPDLTKVFERLKGRKGLSSWLLAPATPAMGPMFQNRALEVDEISALTALFESTAKQGAVPGGSGTLNFFLLGLGGAAAGLALTDFAWRRRLRSVRRALVEGNRPGGNKA